MLGRILMTLLLTVFVLSAFALVRGQVPGSLLSSVHAQPAVARSRTQPVPAASASPFEHTGTLDYATNNAGIPTPYLVYQSDGSVATKALTFTAGSSCVTGYGTFPCALIVSALRTYYGASMVHVTGRANADQFVVDTLRESAG